jgi:hypothetical protein
MVDMNLGVYSLHERQNRKRTTKTTKKAFFEPQGVFTKAKLKRQVPTGTKNGTSNFAVV